MQKSNSGYQAETSVTCQFSIDPRMFARVTFFKIVQELANGIEGKAVKGDSGVVVMVGHAESDGSCGM